MRNLLIVEDDKALQSFLEFALELAGYQTTVAENGAAMFTQLRRDNFNLVLLDLTLPDEDGLVLMRQLRANSSIPVIILTGRQDRDTRLSALELGADDFIAKPFDPKEVTLRVRNMLDRAKVISGTDHQNGKALVRFEGWTLDLDGRTLWDPGGNEVQLTPSEFLILSTLAKNAGRALSRDRLLDVIARGSEPPSGRMIDVFITQLRAKIEADRRKPKIIVTVRDLGYKLGCKVV